MWRKSLTCSYALRVAEITKAESREAVLNRKCRRVSRRGRERLKRPARNFSSIATISEQRRRRIRRKRHVELIEWKRESLAAGFDVRFFARPAIEECFGLELRGDRRKLIHFRPRKEAFGNLIGRKITTHKFNVHTYVAVARECQQRDFMGMRKIESQSQLVLAADEMRFAEWIDSKLQFRGPGPEIAPQNRSQRRSCRDEAIAIRVKTKARRTRLLIL